MHAEYCNHSSTNPCECMILMNINFASVRVRDLAYVSLLTKAGLGKKLKGSRFSMRAEGERERLNERYSVLEPKLHSAAPCLFKNIGACNQRFVKPSIGVWLLWYLAALALPPCWIEHECYRSFYYFTCSRNDYPGTRPLHIWLSKPVLKAS